MTDYPARRAEEAAARRSPTRETDLHPDDPGPTEPGQSSRRLVVTRGSEVKPQKMVWWEPGLVLRAAVNLLAAREGKGKSTVASSWASRETRMGGTVLWIGSEESREHAIVPRLIANDADMGQVIFVDVETDLGTGALVFPLDLIAIEKIIVEHTISMIFLDPAKGLMPPGFSGNDDIAVRQYLEPIAALAARRNVTIVGLSHFGKRSGDDSGKLLLGSVAWSQVARCVLSIAENTDTGTRVLTNTKANYTAADRSVEFRIVGAMVATEDGPTEIGSVQWLGDTTLDARDLLAGAQDEDGPDVDRWLTDLLANGSVKATEVFSAADAAGYSKDQAKRAKKRLRVIADRPMNPGPWFWSLPPDLEPAGREQGAPPDVLPVLPALPVRSEGVQQGADDPREQSVRDCSLPAPCTPSPASMPQKLNNTKPPMPRGHRRTYAGKPADSYPACIVCSKPVVAGQGDVHLSCSKQEAAS
ncbi:AAA family ATPase [Mycobacterium riyadhense]|nr:AAA family ATPase [Mycobacterium riyadhense]